MMGAIVASGSRGGFVGFAVMAVVLGAFAARQRPAMVVAGVLAILCALPLVPDQYWRRIASITDSSKDDYSSSTARKQLLGEAFDAFVENPITGVGAGQFKGYKPYERIEAWHETHNIWLQVASELGIFGLAVFGFLMVRAFSAIWQTRRLLARVRAAAYAARRPSSRKSVPSAPVLSDADATLLDAHAAAMAASMVGFFVCALFSSIAYGWTFYYLLVLAAAPRDILRERIPSLARRRVAAAPALAPGTLPDLPARGVQA
jgi:O-antigen ligase